MNDNSSLATIHPKALTAAEKAYSDYYEFRPMEHAIKAYLEELSKENMLIIGALASGN